MERRQKMEHVTADPGLTVTVEDEPEAWCSSYPVRLGVSAGRNDLSSVTVNGVSCTPDENGIIEVDASGLSAGTFSRDTGWDLKCTD